MSRDPSQAADGCGGLTGHSGQAPLPALQQPGPFFRDRDGPRSRAGEKSARSGAEARLSSFHTHPRPVP